jgi:AdoMet-dependent rRNA methyltransferase SPB1
MPSSSIIIGVDLAPIKPIPRCITFQSDITTDKCRATIRQHLKNWKADTVLHDGAPNVGASWVQDAYTQAALVLQSLKLATDFLAEGGTFVTKIFRSKDYNSLLWVFNQLFSKVEATKPPSSRNVSAEIFVVCRGYKAPKRIDPKFLDPRSVFAELADPTPNNEAKVFNPEKKRRQREGYEEGDYTQFKEAPASEFIQTTDPIAMLGSLNKLSFEQKPNGDIALATLDRLPETTPEIRECCADLKVLGKKEFRMLLKWRLKAREIFGFSSKSKLEAVEQEEVAEIEPMDEELRIQEELQRLQDQDDKKKKKERRRDNDRKQREIVRMQMNMTTPMEFGMEQAGPHGEDAMFALRAVDKSGAVSQIARGKMHTIIEDEKPEGSDEEEVGSDSDGDELEGQLDAMYDQYQERKAAQDANYRAKRARFEHEDGEWTGFSEQENELSSDDDIVEDDQSEVSEEEGPSTLINDLEIGGKESSGLTRKAAMFFQQDIFKGIPGLDEIEDANEVDEDSGIDIEDAMEEDAMEEEAEEVATSTKEASILESESEAESDSESDNGFETVKRKPEDDDWYEEEQEDRMKNGRPDIDIITAEAMTLAHELATGKKSKADMLDDNFNRYSHRDVDGLPDWFLDDERRHSRPIRPITAAGAAAIKEKLRAFNARPIKKVMEAKARKKFKAARRLEKIQKKSAALMEDEGMAEGDKAKAISRMISRAAKKKPKRVTKLVVAKGGNRGISGRPKGTKGRYKMVDKRLKKDVRADKRLKKRNK